MKIKNNVRFLTRGLLSRFLFVAIVSAAIASSIAATDHTEPAARKNTEQTQAVDPAKYNRVAVLAGESRAELDKRKLAVENSYKKWLELKSSPARASQPKAVDAAYQKYLQANLDFVNLERDILVKSGIVSDGVVLSDVINALNAVMPSAAGPQPLKQNNHSPNPIRSGEPRTRPAP